MDDFLDLLPPISSKDWESTGEIFGKVGSEEEAKDIDLHHKTHQENRLKELQVAFNLQPFTQSYHSAEQMMVYN